MKVFSIWNPAQELANIHNRMANCCNRNTSEETSQDQVAWKPVTDVLESESDYRLALELPGLDRKQIDVKLEGSTLEISGERKRPEKSGSWQGYPNERTYGKFARRFTLPKDVETTKLAAEFKDGLLQVTLPKKKEAQPQSIEIKVG